MTRHGREMNIDIKTVNGISIMELHNDMDIYSVSVFKAAINRLIDQDKTSVILNLEKVLYIDSSGLGALITSMMEIEKIGGALKISGLSRHAKKTFEITQSSVLFDIYDTEVEAVKSF